MIAVRYQRGVYLPQQDLWMDPWDGQRFAFVSHAHSDHVAPHSEMIVSERTAHVLRSRLSGRRTEHILPFGKRQTLNGVDLMLLPAGHIFGSAQCLVFADDETLLYTGDFKLRPGKSAEPAEWHRADTLIMETTFGRPRYRFPPTQEVVDQLIGFCRETIDARQVPVLLGYSLGKAQEILCALNGAGLTPMLHDSVYRMTRIYEQLGQSFCQYVRYSARDACGKVVIFPPSANHSQLLRSIPRPRVAMISGWALDLGAVYRYGVDAAFPLSDHADYDDLLRCVELVQPKRVFTLHGFAADFARDLRARGVEAWALSEENQIEFTLSSEREPDPPRSMRFTHKFPSSSPATSRGQANHPSADESGQASYSAQDSEFLAFANVGESIAATSAKLEKIQLLSDYLRNVPTEQLPIVTPYFTGKAFAQSDPRTL